MGLRGGLPPTTGSCLTGRKTRSNTPIIFNSNRVSGLDYEPNTQAQRRITCCKTSSVNMPIPMKTLLNTPQCNQHEQHTLVQECSLLSINQHDTFQQFTMYCMFVYKLCSSLSYGGKKRLFSISVNLLTHFD